jgi:catechol 2,3-dioxygenase-like lactoylglutathione lyase family enzyme
VHAAFDWYRRHLGMDVKMFEEAADAALMLPYTQGEVRSRHAILAINLQGGGGFEIWQYTKRKPKAALQEVLLGDLGIFAGIVRTRNIPQQIEQLKKSGSVVFPLHTTAGGLKSFFFKDPFGNLFRALEDPYTFLKTDHPSGGPMGAILGVSDIEEAARVFSQLLGYNKVAEEAYGLCADYAQLPGGTGSFKRVVLTHSAPRKGAFSRLIGPTVIELVESNDRIPTPIFKGRDWGDLGFIHLCFDIHGMDALGAKCKQMGYPFTVDSASSFDMGEAAGRFTYIEMQGALIEFVETHKIPILKKLGWYLNLKNRKPDKPLPDWILKTLRFTRQKT